MAKMELMTNKLSDTKTNNYKLTKKELFGRILA